MSRARRVLLVTLAVVVALAAGIVGYRLVATAPAGTPQATELADAAVSDSLATATVLAVGEATHGTREFRVARQQILAKVADRGFTTIALEDDAGSVSLADAWLQGGPGTPEEAVRRLGFRIYKTQETVELFAWIRARNEGRPAAERIRLYGIDVARPSAEKAVALDWLAAHDADAASTLAAKLAPLTDESRYDQGINRDVAASAQELADVVARHAASATDDAALRALQAARALVAGRTLAASATADARDRTMADQLAWLLDQRAAAGGRHTLLWAHNGHVDKAGQASAVPGAKLGQLAARRWGSGYKAIGTDARIARFRSDGANIEVSVDSPIRGLFAGTQVGYLEMNAASDANRAVLGRSLPMVSAGEPFAPWNAWLPFLHEVTVRPDAAWDALIYVAESHPVTPLP